MPRTSSNRSNTQASILATVVALFLFALAAVLFVQPGAESTQRLALLFGLLGLAVPTVLGMLKAGQAQEQTNGSLDARIHDAVLVAMTSRRRTDIVPDDQRIPSTIGDVAKVDPDAFLP